MKKFTVLICLLTITLTAFSQSKTTITSHIIDKNTLVVDSSGNPRPYDEWHNLTMTGNYRLKPLNSIVNGRPNTGEWVYTVIPFTAEEKTALKNRLGKPHESPYFTTGDAIDPFRIKDINGNKIEEKAWAGKTVVLNFWFVGCAPCRQEIPELNALVAKYANNPNVIFLGIALDDRSSIRDFIKHTPYNYQLVSDGREYANLFGIKSYPTNVVVGRDGKVLFHSTGYSLNTVDWVAKMVAESETGKAAE